MTMRQKELKKILEFLHAAEKLKRELRHSWLSDGRRESVAEHTWRASLMAILLEPHLKKPINLEKALKMVIIHDLVEIEAGDIPTFEEHRKKEKEKNEIRAIANIKKSLGSETGDEIHGLWLEFENMETEEAKFANALDRIEVLIQHNEADIKTWEKIEYSRNLASADKYCGFDQTIKLFNQIIKNETIEKLEKANKS